MGRLIGIAIGIVRAIGGSECTCRAMAHAIKQAAMMIPITTKTVDHGELSSSSRFFGGFGG
jgi:hypothetical protein